MVRITRTASWPGWYWAKALVQLFGQKKPLLRLGIGLAGILRALRQRKHVRMIQPDLRRNTSIPPVLDALDAVTQTSSKLRNAVAVDELFVSGHFLLERLV